MQAGSLRQFLSAQSIVPSQSLSMPSSHRSLSFLVHEGPAPRASSAFRFADLASIRALLSSSEISLGLWNPMLFSETTRFSHLTWAARWSSAAASRRG